MKSVSDNILIEFEGKWLPEQVSENGIITGTDWTYRPDELRVHEGTVRSTNNGRLAKNYPNDLKIGDRVRCYYNAIDLAVPYINTGTDSAIYSITLFEVLHRINPDGTVDMQCGWVAGEPPPLEIPQGMRYELINNVPYWVSNKTGMVESRVNFSAIKNKMILRHQGEIYVDDWDFENGDTVMMIKDCEFPNNGHNEIEGKKYWFVRQENIIGKIK